MTMVRVKSDGSSYDYGKRYDCGSSTVGDVMDLAIHNTLSV